MNSCVTTTPDQEEMRKRIVARFAGIFERQVRARQYAEGINELVQSTLRRPDIVQSLRQQAAEPWPTSARDAQAFLGTDVANWTRVVRAENIQPPN